MSSRFDKISITIASVRTLASSHPLRGPLVHQGEMNVQNLKDWLEIIYFISGPAVAVFAFLALGQIRVAREQLEAQRRSLQISSKRDALRLTAEQLAEYSAKIVPLINAFDDGVESENVTFFSKFKVEVFQDSIKVSPLINDIDINDAMKVGRQFVDAANALEAFSSYFSSGVADEGMAYLSVGTTFCGAVKRLAPLLVRLGANDMRFSATLHLFTIWSCRLEAETLKKQKREIEDRLRTKSAVTIKTVGADG